MYLKETYREAAEDNYDEDLEKAPQPPAGKEPVVHDPNVQYQRWCSDEEFEQLEDNYNSEAILKLLKNMSYSTPASKILKDLDANTNMTFVDKLLQHIAKWHGKDSDVYKTAQIDRRLFSKIIADRYYQPAKDTCIAFALALRLPLVDAEDLLSRAGYTFSHSNKRDVLLEFFFKEQLYDLDEVNDILYQLNQKTIGRLL